MGAIQNEELPQLREVPEAETIREISMSKNEITGDKLVTKETTDKFRDGYDLIWGKKKVKGCQIITAKQLVEDVMKTLDAKPPEGYTAEELERDNKKGDE